MQETLGPKIRDQIARLPQKPGSYLFKDGSEQVLYVGKAKNLKKRVNSYFRKNPALTPAKLAMLSKISEIETIVVSSELEALILEATLIKKYEPHYNVLLKDDKHYFFIKITTDEDFPKVLTVRKIAKGRARYFGPFTSSRAVRETLGLLQRIFPYRTCGLDLSDPVNGRGQRPCLRYHLKRCDAPCVAKISKQDYQQIIAKIILFLEGKLNFVLKDLTSEMNRAAAHQDFEKAARLRDQIARIKHLTKKQVVLSPKFTNQDVVGFVTNRQNNRAYAVILMIRDGRLLAKENFVLTISKGNSAQEIVRALVLHHYSRATFFPKDLVLSLKIDDQTAISALFKNRLRELHIDQPIKITQATRGIKKGLLRLAEENAIEFRAKKSQELLNSAGQERAALKRLAHSMGLARPPRRVEIYDISNTQGVAAVGSMVVFNQGQPDKSAYRRFKIKTLPERPNDVGMLREVLHRRLNNLAKKSNGWPTPDLIILDGGKPQLNAIQTLLRELDLEIPLASLAKREELIFVPGKKEAIRFKIDSPEMFLVQRMRDEAHRFAITFHRQLRGRRSRRSLLDEIPGIGPQRKKQLLHKYGSINNISLAPAAELNKLIGQKAAQALQEQLG